LRYWIWSSTVTLAVAFRLTAASTAARPPMSFAFKILSFRVTPRPDGRSRQWSPSIGAGTTGKRHTHGRMETPCNKKPRGLRHGVRLLHAGIFRCRSALTDQVIEGAQGGLGALADGDDDLLIGHGGHVAGGEHAGDAGLALGVDHDLAEAVQLDGALQPVAVGQQADLHEDAFQLD